MPNVTTGAGPALGGGWEGSEAAGLLWSCLGSLASGLLEVEVEPQLEVEHWEAGSKDGGRRGGRRTCCNPEILPWLDWIPSLYSHLWDLRLLGCGCRDRGPGS